MPTVVLHQESGLPQAVCGVFWRADQTLLAVSRRHQDQIGLIGGKHDQGETAEQALTRETVEESGVVIDPASLVLLYEGICEPEAPGQQSYWCLTFVAPLPTNQHPRVVEPGIVPVHAGWDELVASSAFPAYNRRVRAAFEAVYGPGPVIL